MARGEKIMRKTTTPSLVAVALLICTSSLPGAKLSSELKGRKASDGPAEVIIQFTAPPSKGVLAALLAKGGNKRAEMAHPHLGLFTLPHAAIAALENNPNVAFV